MATVTIKLISEGEISVWMDFYNTGIFLKSGSYQHLLKYQKNLMQKNVRTTE